MASGYIIDEFSPLADPDEEAARKRAEAVGRPAVASPAADVQNPAPAVVAQNDPSAASVAPDPSPGADDPSLKVRPGVALNADSSLSQPAVDASATPAAAQATGSPNWSDTVRSANDAQAQLGQGASQDMQSFRDRYKAKQARKDQLERQRASVAQPIAVRDQNGSVLPEYKPSFTQRLLRGVAAIQRGGILGAANPRMEGVAGYGDPNDAYGRAVNVQQQRVAGLDTAIAGIDKDEKDAFEQAKGMAAEGRATAAIYKGITDAATAQQGAETKTSQLPFEAQRAYNESPAGKAEAASKISQAQVDARTRTADQMKLKGTNRTLFMLNGRIPDPRQATSEDIARSAAAAAWHRDNPGKQPSLADINAINQSASGRAGLTAAGGQMQDAPGQPLNDPAWEAMAQAVGKGDKKAMALNSRSSPLQVAVMHRAQEINPKLSDNLYTTKQAFKTKGDADKVQSLGVAIAHASNALENSSKVGYNPLINHPGFQTSAPATASTAYMKDMTMATDEMSKLIKLGVVTQAEADGYKSRMDNPRQDIRDAALKEFITNFGARARSMFQKYKVGTDGSEFPAEEFYDKPTLEKLKQNGVFDGDGAPAAASASPASSSGAFDFNAFPVDKP